MHPFGISFLIDKFIVIIVNTNYIQVDKESDQETPQSKKKKILMFAQILKSRLG